MSAVQLAAAWAPVEAWLDRADPSCPCVDLVREYVASWRAHRAAGSDPRDEAAQWANLREAVRALQRRRAADPEDDALEDLARAIAGGVGDPPLGAAGDPPNLLAALGAAPAAVAGQLAGVAAPAIGALAAEAGRAAAPAAAEALRPAAAAAGREAGAAAAAGASRGGLLALALGLGLAAAAAAWHLARPPTADAGEAPVIGGRSKSVQKKEKDRRG